MRWIAVLVAGAVGAIGVAGATATPVRRPITQDDSGKTFRLARGADVTFRLSNRWIWSTPRSSTKAIDLVPVEYLIDPGFREWRVEGRARGRAIVRAYGKPNCDACTRAARRLSVTFIVGTS
jgi:hypothetical protein